MLQSTCAVHAGSSGGPLLSAHDGCLLGEPPSPLHPQRVPIALLPLVTSPPSRHRGQQRAGQHGGDHLPTPQLLHPHLPAAHTPRPLSLQWEPCRLRPAQRRQRGSTGGVAAAAAAPQQAVTPSQNWSASIKALTRALESLVVAGVGGTWWPPKQGAFGDRALWRGVEGPGTGMERSTQHGRLFHNTAAASTARTGGRGYGGDRWGGGGCWWWVGSVLLFSHFFPNFRLLVHFLTTQQHARFYSPPAPRPPRKIKLIKNKNKKSADGGVGGTSSAPRCSPPARRGARPGERPTALSRLGPGAAPALCAGGQRGDRGCPQPCPPPLYQM